MNVLLINPNRYKFPPVPPIGLEHVAGSLESGGHNTSLLDLCFSKDIYGDVDDAVRSFSPDLVGVTVRNIDTVLYQTNEFFLDEIRDIIGHIKSRHGLKVIIGGTGVLTNPEGVTRYLGADYAAAGPAEYCLDEVLRNIGGGEEGQKICRGKYRYDISCPRRKEGVDYGRYFEQGGIAGFATHTGCGSSCVYCIEANTPVSYRRIDEVIAEIRGFVDAGYGKFHLCDPEFNEDLDYCIDFCEALKQSRMIMDWALYMKPANYNRKLLRLMKESGVSLITLTVDSWKKCPLYWSDIEKIVFGAKSFGIKIVVDFLAGFPYEEEETLPFYLDMFRRVQPDRVGINTYIRLYRSLKISDIIAKDVHLKACLSGDVGDATLVKPVFYNQVRTEKVAELIRGESLFRIEGLERGVNYER